MKNVLLLTNRDSDNCGDQLMEACDISLMHTVMKNLGYAREDYELRSRAAAFVSRKCVETHDPELIAKAEEVIRDADVVVFGGAPMFNYTYQIFYERTSMIVDLAQKWNIPVIFSAVGVEQFDESDERARRIKNALNQSCVKMITTRDGMKLLERIKERPDLKIGKVSDPAVFADRIMEKYDRRRSSENLRQMPEDEMPPRKKIGVFVLRADGFVNNGYSFSRYQAAQFWVDLARELEMRGYDYEFLTSGHFGDEAVLDALARDYGIPEGKCLFAMNTPEMLAERVSGFDGIISCRLHPSITAYAFGIPAVGIVWNAKVPGFYEGMGYPSRAINTSGMTAKSVMDALEKAMDEGVEKDPAYMTPIYTMLFDAMKESIGEKEGSLERNAYSYDELIAALEPFEGTSEEEKQRKLIRKFRRTYMNYNKVSEKLKEEQRWKQKLRDKVPYKLYSRCVKVYKKAFKS